MHHETYSPEQEPRVLAIDPSSKGFGYAVFEGPARLIDWGVKEVRGNDNKRCLQQLATLLRYYQPHVFVAEDCSAKNSRRCSRVRALIRRVIADASARGIKSHRCSRRAVRKAFSRSGAVTKHQIAHAIATLLPELGPQVPPFRKPWMSEDSRMSIFDAASFALTYFAAARRQRQSAESRQRHEFA